jgi:hypothetical protein
METTRAAGNRESLRSERAGCLWTSGADEALGCTQGGGLKPALTLSSFGL